MRAHRGAFVFESKRQLFMQTDTMQASAQQIAKTYRNPVFRHDFPDPFALKFCGEYWGYCTGFAPDGKRFGVIRSRDLVNWSWVGGALVPPDEFRDANCWWAPEVVYENGRFLMYYSVGNETFMQIRVAVADHPAGEFIDSGHRLTTEDFAIDAHVFTDANGARYLFYATDFLDYKNIGTGTVRARMQDSFTLAEPPRPVARALYDWQVYDPKRESKGGVRWHTIEGPFVFKRKGVYYEMFSGGNWQNLSYGVSFATTDDINTPYEWTQVADGQRVLPILRTIPGEVIGPGHNSAVRGVNNMEMFCVYHRWDALSDGVSARTLAIDRMDWVGERMTVLGPTDTEQPAPFQPTIVDFFDGDKLDARWRIESGNWSVRNNACLQESKEGAARIVCETGASNFVIEASLRAVEAADERAGYGVALIDERGEELFVLLNPQGRQVVMKTPDGERWFSAHAVPQQSEEFRFDAFHLLRLQVNGTTLRALLDDAELLKAQLKTSIARCGFVTENASAQFAGFALTVGFEDLFTEIDLAPDALGWRTKSSGGDWLIEGNHLSFMLGNGAQDKSLLSANGAAFKGDALENYEFTVNAQLAARDTPPQVTNAASPPQKDEVAYGFYPAASSDAGDLYSVVCRNGEWFLTVSDAGDSPPKQAFALGGAFDVLAHQQFRFRKRGGRLEIFLEAVKFGETEVNAAPSAVGLYAPRAGVRFETVRVFAI